MRSVKYNFCKDLSTSFQHRVLPPETCFCTI